MPDLVRLAYYPFLPEVREAVREAGPDLGALLASPLYLGARLRAKERIEGALGEGFQAAQVLDERTALLELLSIPVARMAAVLLGDKTLADALLPVPDERRLAVLPSGAVPPNPSELLMLRRYADVIEMLRGESDFVIIDTPPVLPVADARVVASVVDITLLVVAANASGPISTTSRASMSPSSSV